MNKIKKALDVLSGDCTNPIIKADMIKVLHEQLTGLENSFNASCNHNLELTEENDKLELDKKRLDWLADADNEIGNVQLPSECVERNIDSLRHAIDDAMALNT